MVIDDLLGNNNPQAGQAEKAKIPNKLLLMTKSSFQTDFIHPGMI